MEYNQRRCKKDLKFISCYYQFIVEKLFRSVLKGNLPAGKRIPLARISWNFRTYFLWRKKHISQRSFVISVGSTSNAIIFIYRGQGWKKKIKKIATDHLLILDVDNFLRKSNSIFKQFHSKNL